VKEGMERKSNTSQKIAIFTRAQTPNTQHPDVVVEDATQIFLKFCHGSVFVT